MKRWPQRKVYFWESAPFFRVAAPFAAGIFYYDRLGARITTVTYPVGISIAALAIFIILSGYDKVKPLGWIAAQICLTCVGISAAYFGDVRNDQSWYGRTTGKGRDYLVRIVEQPTEKENSWKLTVEVINAIGKGSMTPVAGTAFVYLYKDGGPMSLHEGDSVFVADKWAMIKNAGNPYEFDYATYCKRNNIRYQQSAGIKDTRLYATNDEKEQTWTTKAHDLCARQLNNYITDSKARGLIQAMLLGDEADLDEDLRQSYADTGIVHIIAISGGNVIIFFAAVAWLLSWLKDRKHFWIKYAIALPLVWFYVIMAGAPPSAVRAAIMFSLLAISVMAEQNNNGLNTLFATAFILLFARPMWLFSPGFQLSFTAVLSLIIFYKPIKFLASPKNRVAYKLWDVAAASMAAELLVAPLVIYYFHTFPLLFLVANVAAFLFMEAVLILSMLVIAISWMPLVAKGVGILTTWLVQVFDYIIKILQQANPASFRFLWITGIELVVCYVLIAALSAFGIRKNKKGLFIALAACGVLLVLLNVDEYRRLGQERLVIYNTGKANRVEVVKGTKFHVLRDDTMAARKVAYATTAAHMGMGAWRQGGAVKKDLIMVGGKQILLLDTMPGTTAKFPVDYLFVNLREMPDMAKLKAVYEPLLTIISGRYNRREQDQISRDARGYGMRIHFVTRDGAFMVGE